MRVSFLQAAYGTAVFLFKMQRNHGQKYIIIMLSEMPRLYCACLPWQYSWKIEIQKYVSCIRHLKTVWYFIITVHLNSFKILEQRIPLVSIAASQPAVEEDAHRR